MRLALFLVVPVVLGATGCPGGAAQSPGGVPAPVQPLPAVFSPYCSTVLLRDMSYMQDDGNNRWTGLPGLTVPRGTQIVLEHRFFSWFAGYAFLSDGRVVRIEGDFKRGFVPGVDIEPTCPPPESFEPLVFVLLRDGELHADPTLSSAPCVLRMGQAFPPFRYSIDPGPDSLTTPELGPLCGFTRGFTHGLVYGDLVPR